jgi:hypothetical protein
MSESKPVPKPWSDVLGKETRWWVIFLLRFDWMCEHIAFWFSRLALIEVLEYIGKLSLLGALLVWLCEKRERSENFENAKRSRHYAAWQTINSASGRPGNGGRTDALEDLNRDGVSLAGVDVSGSAVFATGLILTNASLVNANFRGARLIGVTFSGADLSNAHFDAINCTFGKFIGAKMNGITLTNTTFFGCDFLSSRHWNFEFGKQSIPVLQLSAMSFVCEWQRRNQYGFADCVRRCNFANASVTFDDELLLKLDRRFTNCNIFGATSPRNWFQDWAIRFCGGLSVNKTNYADWLSWLDTNGKLSEMAISDRNSLGLPNNPRTSR